jgi:hypothetical protein
MKNTTLTLGALAGTIACSQAALIGLYEFDNAANLGEATIGVDGTALSTGIGTAATGFIGGGIDVSGGLTGVNLGTQYDSTFSTGVFTVTFRVNFISTTSDQPLLSWASWDTFDGSNRQGITIATQGNNNPDLQAIIGDGSSRVDAGDGAGGPELTVGQWTTIALSVDSVNDTASFYSILDGGNPTEVATVSLAGFGSDLSSRAASTFVIGEHGPAGGSNDPYNGGAISAIFDDVRIYDTALTQVEIEQIAAVPEPSSTALLGLGGLALILRRKK